MGEFLIITSISFKGNNTWSTLMSPFFCIIMRWSPYSNRALHLTGGEYEVEVGVGVDVGNATTAIQREGINSHHKISNRGLCNRIVLKSGLCLEISIAYQQSRLVVFDWLFSSLSVEKIKLYPGILHWKTCSPSKMILLYKDKPESNLRDNEK